MKLKDIIGWLGVLLILAAFALTTFGVINAENLVYGVMNLFGALGIITSSYAKKDFQPVILNIIWLAVAIFAIIRSVA